MQSHDHTCVSVWIDNLRWFPILNDKKIIFFLKIQLFKMTQCRAAYVSSEFWHKFEPKRLLQSFQFSLSCVWSIFFRLYRGFFNSFVWQSFFRAALVGFTAGDSRCFTNMITIHAMKVFYSKNYYYTTNSSNPNG